MAAKVLLTICNYNAHQNHALDYSLEKLRTLKDENTIISYFDNASKDGSVEVLQRANDLIDLAVYSKKNMGKAYAMNRLFQMATSMYGIADTDVLVNLDSDIVIQNPTFLADIRTICAAIPFKYLGFKMYTDLDMTNGSAHHYYVAQQRLTLNTWSFDVVQSCYGLAGGILVIPVSHYRKVNGYSERLGCNGTSAIYGGDDSTLLYQLFRAYPNELALCCTDKWIVHLDTLDTEYAKWKANCVKTMQQYGMASSKIPSSGFYD